MKTETKTVELRTIKADEGKWLTDGLFFMKSVVLGANENSENWHEITEEEYDQIIENAKNKAESEI